MASDDVRCCSLGSGSALEWRMPLQLSFYAPRRAPGGETCLETDFVFFYGWQKANIDNSTRWSRTGFDSDRQCET